MELGPGRGTLMADILRVARRARIFPRRVSVHLVETSPVLRERQAETLKPAGHVRRMARLVRTTCRTARCLLVANEFFDALPIRQFVRLDVWRERVVGLDEQERLVFGVGPGMLDGRAGGQGRDRSSRSALPARR